MTYPYSTFAANKTDTSTATPNQHASDHNAVESALNDIKTVLGTTPTVAQTPALLGRAELQANFTVTTTSTTITGLAIPLPAALIPANGVTVEAQIPFVQSSASSPTWVAVWLLEDGVVIQESIIGLGASTFTSITCKREGWPATTANHTYIAQASTGANTATILGQNSGGTAIIPFLSVRSC